MTTATNSSPVSPPTYPSSVRVPRLEIFVQLRVGLGDVAEDPVYVSVSGTQTYGGDPTFSGTDAPPLGASVDTSGLTCSDVTPATAIAPSLPVGTDSILAPSCSQGLSLGFYAAGSAIVYTSTQNDFTLNPAPLTITASSEPMTYGANVPAITPSIGLREQQQCLVTEFAACLHDHLHEYEFGVRLAVHVHLQRSCRHELHHQLRTRRGDVNPAPLTITATSDK